MQPNHRLVTLVFLAGILLSGMAKAENAIKQVQVRKDGENVLVKIDMRDPVKTPPGNWSIVEPPRLVFDFPDTQNLTGQTAQKVDTGDLRSLNLVQADQLTRLVLNLNRTVSFSTDVDGASIYVRLDRRADTGDRSASSAVLPAQAHSAATMTVSTPDAVVRDLLFRRGEDGQGIVTVDLSDGTLPIDIQRTPTGLAIQLSDVELPERLQNRRDTVDFATPVTQLTAQRTRTGARLDIQAKGNWFHQAHLTNNALTVEIKPIPTEDLNKLVQRGQQGQKVSINFFDAEATMVLRTLAEISSKNVMVDPSLANRRVTVNLENIPYDQALDIVMAQVGASMRIRNDVVLFGDRAVLLKRDQDLADEIARANDTAPLVAETFELNYIKVADVAALISSALDSQTGTSPAPSPGGQASGQTGNSGTQAKGGLLSSRGSMTRHEPTNKLFIRDTAERIEAIRQVIRSVDIPVKQVMIEARVVSAGTGFSRYLGMRLGVNDLSNTTGSGIGNQLVGNTYWAAGQTTADLATATGQTSASRSAPTTPFFGPSINLPNNSASNKFAISVFNSSLTKFINLELQAGEDENKLTNISTPRIVTANNKEATILKGTQVAYIGSSGTGAPTVTFQNATLTLKVKPQVAPNGTVILKLDITNDELGPTTANGQPSILKSQISTEVTVENGGTTVLGGVIKENSTKSEERIPYLSDIPIVGKFFKSTTNKNQNEELLVFITPRVIDSGMFNQAANR